MTALSFTSCIAPNHDDFWSSVLAYLAEKLAQPVNFVIDLDWAQRYEALDAGAIQLAAVCGAPYVRRRALAMPTVELLAAPVFRAPLYDGRPVYYSDVIVHSDSNFHTFADLHGTSFAFNEAGSFSGYEAMRYYLAANGEKGDYFARAIQSGSHAQSIRMILDHTADCAAIDSTMFEQALVDSPEIAAQLRVVELIGPSPMLPWVTSTQLDPGLRTQLRQELIAMHDDPSGAALLYSTPVARFAPVSDADYDPMRNMLELAASVEFIIS